ncbi:hypothetical protein Syun_000248 [Stephania yunnanensis]|uniref:Fe2OG dioxygenase domain-containing protein n=1 Tax=Stephania yunnanensis TaxID=152371 RepID=A0AAP0LCU3_9MAGN
MPSSTVNLSSYPPLFRPPNLTHQAQTTSAPSMAADPPDLLPLVDFQDLQPKQLGQACRDWGVFRLINHGVPGTLLSGLSEQAMEMFNLSFETKKDQFTDPITYFWSTPALTAQSVAQSVRNVNWVEGFNVPLCQLPLLQTQHPSSFTSFRSRLEEYGKHMGRLGRAMFEAMLEDLKLDKENYSSYLAESTAFIRAYRYPQCSDATRVSGMDAHTDSSIMTILSQDDVGGLQVCRDNCWVHVKPVPGTLVVNIGDMMQAISNEEYKSVMHRVKANQVKERFSICYFVFPGEDTVIQSSRYMPFTYKQFQAQVQRDVKATGAKVGLARFKRDCSF